MRLYLSSYRIGNHAQKLLELLGSGRRVGIIANAVDNVSSENRLEYRRNTYNIHDVFKEMGLAPHEIDLRRYFDKKDNLKEELKKYDLIWVNGGNCFLLRRAMEYSGFGDIITDMLEKDEVVYGGFSAGICLLGPTLKGIELCDEAEKISEGYSPEIIWDGLNLIPYSIAPHYRSDHSESPMIENVVAYFDEHSMPYYALRDGDVLIRDGSDLKLYKLEDGIPNPLDMNKEKRFPANKTQPNRNSLL
jgi:dipeptidase E